MNKDDELAESVERRVWAERRVRLPNPWSGLRARQDRREALTHVAVRIEVYMLCRSAEPLVISELQHLTRRRSRMR